jgi:hypothetical protein
MKSNNIKDATFTIPSNKKNYLSFKKNIYKQVDKSIRAGIPNLLSTTYHRMDIQKICVPPNILKHSFNEADGLVTLTFFYDVNFYNCIVIFPS